MSSLADKIAAAKLALRKAGKTGYGEGLEDETIIIEAAPVEGKKEKPQRTRYVTVHKRRGNPVVYDLITGQSKEVTFD